MLSKIFNQIPYTCKLINYHDGLPISSGCGVFISPNHVLTSRHVVKKSFKNSSVLTVVNSGFNSIKTSKICSNDNFEVGFCLSSDPDIDIALITSPIPLSKIYLKIASSFNDKDTKTTLISPNYRFNRSSKGHYLGPNLDYRPDKNGVRPYTEFKFSNQPREGMSGSPIVNSQGDIISLLCAEATVIREIRKFGRPIGNNVGPTPEKLFEFYEPHRSHVESFHI